MIYLCRVHVMIRCGSGVMMATMGCRCTIEGHASTVWDAVLCHFQRRETDRACGADLSIRVWAEATLNDASKWVSTLFEGAQRPVYMRAVSGNRVASCSRRRRVAALV